MDRRQRAAIWLAGYGMPTFASWLYRYWMYRFERPVFVGTLPPRAEYDVVTADEERVSAIRERIAKAKIEAQKAYIEACKEFNRPGRESWVKHYESRRALERDMEFLLAACPEEKP